MSAFLAVYLRELLILKRRLKRQIAGMAVSPLLYMLTFGYALGRHLEMGGRSYLEFLVPGLIAMTSMTQGFSIAQEINVARFYFCVFEEIQAAPASRLAYVMGEICAGLTRVALSVLVVIVLGWLFGVWPHYGPFFWLAVLLNGFTFSALAVALAMLVKSHADQSLLTNFIITPMAFLGGTFFPVENLPDWAQALLSVLPLTHAAQAIRAAAVGDAPEWLPFAVLVATGVACLILAVWTVEKARD
ncbi:MAG: ABC transporter permease [Candidatus Accumulibacter sp.]|jgi:ABC-type multidrug transport system permease subunit|nr:ABC transporter permease [Accumulibacter sp.]